MTRTKLMPKDALWQAIQRMLDAYADDCAGLTVNQAHQDLDIVEGLLEAYAYSMNNQVEADQQAAAQTRIEQYRAELEPTPPAIVRYRMERQHKQTADEDSWSTVALFTDFRSARDTLRKPGSAAYNYRLSGELQL